MTESRIQEFDEIAEQWLAWVERRVVEFGRGDTETTLSVRPEGKFWLGRLAPQARVAQSANDALERLAPCAIGLNFRPQESSPWKFEAEIRCAVWRQTTQDNQWEKCGPIAVTVPLEVKIGDEDCLFAAEELRNGLADALGNSGHAAALYASCRLANGEPEITLQLVNTSPIDTPQVPDPNLYECSLVVRGIGTRPIRLVGLPESFRYDRTLPAYGINCGIARNNNGELATVDVPSESKRRPRFWRAELPDPDLRFATLAEEPIPACERLVMAFREWGDEVWSSSTLNARAAAELWTPEMSAEAQQAAEDYRAELQRLMAGITALQEDANLRRAFCCMNAAMEFSAAGKYDRWRPFQVGFLLSNLTAVVNHHQESETVDIVWFATGGGKTETYLGLLLTAAFHDRLTGKLSGVTAWTRFPLRLLSLQQTQRFADALGAADVVREREKIGGSPFSLGFFIGSGATPNSIKANIENAEPGQPDPDDPAMPERYRMLSHCPYCRSQALQMRFDRRLWNLNHCCTNESCPNSADDKVIPFYLVDDEIYRFLPTVIVGTLDKAAIVAQQQAARGLVGPPYGRCDKPGHGYVYAPRSKSPRGCLVPGCNGRSQPLDQPPEKFAQSFRLQDELHLLRDSLGAVDAHYEALLDSLQLELTGRKPKIIASSATLAGYQKQTAVLYRRAARVFPQPPPMEGQGFWTSDSAQTMRRYVAIAPRGATIEFAVDRIFEMQQRLARELVNDPVAVCREIGLDVRWAEDLASRYGTAVAYGNTIRDLDAVVRSWETQIQVEGELNVESLTGKTEFSAVRDILRRLEKPEDDFQRRIHLVSASAMMSHGVDVDRLNTMVMIGLPLGAAEFIQASARVGRRWPGIVFVVHRLNREREAGVYRCFGKFIQQADRFVEAIPITRRSRNVLERTLPGLAHSRILHLHEPRSGGALTTPTRMRAYRDNGSYPVGDESEAVIAALGFDAGLDETLRSDVREWFDRFDENIRNLGEARFVSELLPNKLMTSLRDVEEQVPVYGQRRSRR